MLPVTRRQLRALARQAARSAYCPYSRFHVGAAVLTDEGRFHVGCNVENASYGLTLCAERTAIFSAVAAGMRQMRAIALTCPDAAPDAVAAYRMPCGACRQVIAEFATPETLIVVDAVADYHLPDLLPQAFVLPSQDQARTKRPLQFARDSSPNLDRVDGVVTSDRAAAERAALMGLHAILLGATGEGDIVHHCPDDESVDRLIRDLSQ